MEQKNPASTDTVDLHAGDRPTEPKTSLSRVLVVDDDDALRRLIRIELEGEYDVVDSGEPDQGLALALETKPDAILLDLRMPKYSGYELLQTFTSFSRTHTIPILVVSGESGEHTPEYCKQLGATAYFGKPIDFAAVRACLQKVIQHRPHIPRSEVRVRLRVSLVLRGSDGAGQAFEIPATTEDVSLSGFLCACTADLQAGSHVDVYLPRYGMKRVGKARIVHAIPTSETTRRYGCRFEQKDGPWVLE